MEWISVKDRLPEEGIEVLTIDTSRLGSPGYVQYGLDYIVHITNEPYIWARRLYDDQNKVTHWMPLPKPPEE